MFDKLKNKLSSSTETLSLDITGEHYYRNNLKTIKRPLNPDYKNKSIGGIVCKYEDVVVPATIMSKPNSYDKSALVVACNGKPLGYIRQEDKAMLQKIMKRIVECKAYICNGECRIDDVKRTDVEPDVSLVIKYRV